MFSEPAAVKAIVDALFVSRDAVKQHLNRLYRKFEIPEADQRKRLSLANAALQRGAVSIADLSPDGT